MPAMRISGARWKLGWRRRFSQLEAVRTAAKNTYIQYASLAGDADINAQKVNWQTVLTGVNMTRLLELAPSYITEEEIYTIAALSQDKLISLREALIERVRTQMERGITDDDVEELAETVRSGLVSGGLFHGGAGAAGRDAGGEYRQGKPSGV